MERETQCEFVTEIFEETALVLGGIVAVCRIDDAVVWRLVNAFDALRQRALRRIAEGEADGATPRSSAARAEPHPAIEEFLRKVRGGARRSLDGEPR